MPKNYLYWIGVIPDTDVVSKRFKYGNYEWMQYSRYTWEYWCKKNNVTFVHYNKPTFDDCMRHKITWQRWFDYDKYVPSDWDSFMSVDASIMVRWDAPNYFDLGDGEMSVMRANENWKWVSESIAGYTDMFPGLDFRYKDYFCGGMVLFRKKNEYILKDIKKFFFDNIDTILKKEDKEVLRGTDQPVINYITQSHNEKLHYWSPTEVVNHLYRRNILGHNWQLQTDPTPFFIKYFKAWQFSGFSDRGDTRTQLMKSTWEYIKNKYV